MTDALRVRVHITSISETLSTIKPNNTSIYSKRMTLIRRVQGIIMLNGYCMPTIQTRMSLANTYKLYSYMYIVIYV